MKPRTKLQHRVFGLSKELNEITNTQKEWAYKYCLEHKAYANKSSAFCLDCGKTFSPQIVHRKKAVCPHCNTKLQVEFTRKTTDKQTSYLAITEVVEEFQVVRNFEIIAVYKKGQEVCLSLNEILQYWIDDKGKRTLIGLKHNYNWCMDSWSGDWEIRVESNSWYNKDKFEIYPYKYHPDSVFKPELKKIGINKNLQGLHVFEAMNIIPHNSKAETLLKAKQFSLLSKSENHLLNYYWPSIKICLRNKYKIKDAGIYFDYLDLLKYFKKDIRNAKFVCPKNLKKQHDILVEKKRKIQQAEERERKRREIIERQKRLANAKVEYAERIQKFLELEFKKGNIQISVLKSIEEFKVEGDVLKHCVYANEYYLKEDSLLLSAKVNGERTETIEIILSKLQISQARGFRNNATEHHDKIVNLVKKNLPKIAEIAKQAAA